METIISYKKLSHLFLFPGIIYGKIQQLVELSARNWPLKETIRERNFASVYFKVGVKGGVAVRGIAEFTFHFVKVIY